MVAIVFKQPESVMTELERIVNKNATPETIITLDTVTVPEMRKTNNPYLDRVEKRTSELSVVIFQNIAQTNGYEAMVRRRLTREGKNADDFVLGPRRWGTRIPNTPFVEHRGDRYLEVIALWPGTTNYHFIDSGRKVNMARLRPYLTRIPAPAQGGLDDKVIVRTFHTSSIASITIGDWTYYDIAA